MQIGYCTAESVKLSDICEASGGWCFGRLQCVNHANFHAAELQVNINYTNKKSLAYVAAGNLFYIVLPPDMGE